MNDNRLYAFEDISIRVETASAELLFFLEEYTHLGKHVSPSEKSIALKFAEVESLDPYLAALSADAAVLSDRTANIDGERRFVVYSTGDGRKIYFYEQFGLVSVDPNSCEIVSFCSAKANRTDITPFIILVVHPLIRLLRKFGFLFLHAACVAVNGNPVLITGLSGRGKSTSTYALIDKGHLALTDEVTLIRKEEGSGIYSAYTFIDWIKITKAAKERFFWQAKPILEFADECILKLSELNGKDVTNLRGVGGIFILEQTGKSETAIADVDALSVVPELLPSSLNIVDKLNAETDLGFMLELLETVRCRKVFFGTDMERFACEMEKALAADNV